MTPFLSVLFVAIGLTAILNSIVTSRSRALEFPRHHEPVAAGRRLLSVLLGVIITVCGAGMLVFSLTG